MINKIFLGLLALLYASRTDCLIVQISMMKAGTHLLITLLEKLTHKKMTFIGREGLRTMKINKQDVINVTPKDFKFLSSLPAFRFWATHSPYVKTYALTLSHPHYRILYLYRDPRDVVVSLALYIQDKDKKWWPHAQTLSVEQVITRLIAGGESLHQMPDHISCHGIRHAYEAYMPWTKLPNALAIRFEDLIGPHGGGDAYTQLNTIMAIAKHVDHPLEPYEAAYLGEAIFGAGLTFNKGQIGSWKKYFTQEHKDLFKEHAGQLLINLGYENDLNW